MQLSDLVKVSEEDLAWLDPDRSPIEAARALPQLGPKVVLLTQGPASATIVSPRGETPVAPVSGQDEESQDA